MKNILITGSNSGLGKHCLNYFDGIGFNKQTHYETILEQAKQQPFTAIIHCAFNTRPEISTSSLYTYLNDTLLLTQKVAQIPHQKFIFISSVDVYPKSDFLHHEEEEINLKDVENIYGISKLLSESIVRHETQNYLILRPAALLGPDAKKNSLMRILFDLHPTITLSKLSSFNYILHSDVSHFIATALNQNLTGVYNLAACNNIALGELTDLFKKNVTFGHYVYDVGNIANKKAAEITDVFKKSSLENIHLFKKTILENICHQNQ